MITADDFFEETGSIMVGVMVVTAVGVRGGIMICCGMTDSADFGMGDDDGVDLEEDGEEDDNEKGVDVGEEENEECPNLLSTF
jgi:hypothetical protein